MDVPFLLANPPDFLERQKAKRHHMCPSIDVINFWAPQYAMHENALKAAHHQNDLSFHLQQSLNCYRATALYDQAKETSLYKVRTQHVFFKNFLDGEETVTLPKVFQSADIALINMQDDYNHDANVETMTSSMMHDDLCGLNLLAHNTSQAILRFLLCISAARSAGYKQIIILLPYMPYSRQDRPHRNDEGCPLGARLICDIMVAAGATHIMTCEAHSRTLYDHPCVTSVPVLEAAAIKLMNVTAQSMGSSQRPQKRLHESVDRKSMHLKGHKNICVISPDKGSYERARRVADALSRQNIEGARQISCFAMEKTRHPNTHHGHDERMSLSIELPRELRIFLDSYKKNFRQDDLQVLVVDDIISSGRTLSQTLDCLKCYGFVKPIALVAHIMPHIQTLKRLAQHNAQIYTTFFVTPPPFCYDHGAKRIDMNDVIGQYMTQYIYGLC